MRDDVSGSLEQVGAIPIIPKNQLILLQMHA
jgi:hypothetical protein